MSSQYLPFPIAPLRSGIDKSIGIPWLTPEDAWQDLIDCFLYRGQLIKRYGSQWFDSMPYAIDGGSGHHYQNIASISNTISALVTLTASHNLVTDDIVRLTDVEGLTTMPDDTPINGTRWKITVVSPTSFTLNNTAAFAGSYTSDTGTASSMPYPGTSNEGEQILCICNYIDANNDPVLMILDSNRAAIFDNSQTNNCFIPLGYTDYLNGDTNLFWYENYKSANVADPVIYFTNNVGMWYWNTTDLTDLSAKEAGLLEFSPVYGASSDDKVTTCLMIRNLGNRLCLFNTLEGTPTSPNPRRVRWCSENGDPLQADQGEEWDDTVEGKGSFIDVPNANYLISLGQIQTNLLLCSRGVQLGSFIEMRPTGDPKVPFAFVQISNSRNINSTFGTIILDRQITALGNGGLVTCDGNSAGRYDEKVPNFAVDTIEQSRFSQCFGLRNDLHWQTWLLYPSNEEGNPVRNTNALIFNYQDESWSIYQMEFSCLGNFYNQEADPTWGSLGSATYQELGNQTWGEFIQQQSLGLLAGDYIGNVWLMDQEDVNDDLRGNTVFGQTPDTGVEIVMNAVSRQWFPFVKEATSAQFGYIDFVVDFNPNTRVNVDFSVDNGPVYASRSFTCSPLNSISSGPIEYILQDASGRVNSPGHNLITGQTIYIFGVQGMTQVNGVGFTITVLDANNYNLNVDTTSYSAYEDGGVWTTQNIGNSPFLRRLYPNQNGTFHELAITVSGKNTPFTLSAMILYMKPTGRIYKGSA